MASFLERYRAGEREAVWAELFMLGDQVRLDPVYADAVSVARETMYRVRQNIEILIPRLIGIGYQFGMGFFEGSSPDQIKFAQREAPVFAPPKENVLSQIAELEQITGTLPLSVRAFYEIVGSVNFVGNCPGWHADAQHALDPLFVYPIEVNLKVCRDRRELKAESEPESERAFLPYRLLIALGEDAKYGAEGETYEIELPSLGADVWLIDEWHDTTFINYLRICFQWGGLSGLDRLDDPPANDLVYLTDGLLPI